MILWLNQGKIDYGTPGMMLQTLSKGRVGSGHDLAIYFIPQGEGIVGYTGIRV